MNKKRDCLKCNKNFTSLGFHNRLCFSCNVLINSPEIKQLEDAEYYQENKERIMANYFMRKAK